MLKRYRISPGAKVDLKDLDPAEHPKVRDKDEAAALVAPLVAKLEHLQERLYAEGRRSLLIVLQGTDTAGKDGTIRHVMSGVNPQGCQVTSFKEPNKTELAHDFLWRVHRAVPRRGLIGIFNRSHYEDVLVTRVHGAVDGDEALRRFKEIVAFEKLLHAAGTRILKFFLHISKDEQRRRLQARADDPKKRWKLSGADLKERAFWKDYRRAYEELLGATSTDHAPWYVVPADHKWFRDYVVARVIVKALEDMDPTIPPPDPTLNYDKLKVV